MDIAKQPAPLRHRVLGVVAPPSRPTLRGALWLACALSVPVFAGLTLVDWLFG